MDLNKKQRNLKNIQDNCWYLKMFQVLYEHKTNERGEKRVGNKEEQFTLKELRARKNTTQAQIASDLGISPQTYCVWERDISNVAVSKVKAVANYFGVGLNQIFFT